MLNFKPIDENNFRECMRLKVKDSQLEFVDRGNYVALAKAYVFRDRAYPFAIYDDDEMIGFLQYRDMPELGNYLLDKIMIKEERQNKGYGNAAMKHLIDMLKADGKYRKLCLCVHVDNAEAIRLYEKFGFTQCEEEEEKEVVLGIEW